MADLQAEVERLTARVDQLLAYGTAQVERRRAVEADRDAARREVDVLRHLLQLARRDAAELTRAERETIDIALSCGPVATTEARAFLEPDLPGAPRS